MDFIQWMLSRQNVIMLQHPYPIKKQGRIKGRIKGNKTQGRDIYKIYIYYKYIIMDKLLADLEVSDLTGVYSTNQNLLITANKIAKKTREDAKKAREYANKMVEISMKIADGQRQKAEEKAQEAEEKAQKAKEAALLEAARQMGGKYKRKRERRSKQQKSKRYKNKYKNKYYTKTKKRCSCKVKTKI